MAEQDTQTVESINGKLQGGFKMDVIPVDKVEFLEKNARFMKNEQFQNLVENIRKDGAISSVPFCYLQENGKYKVLSGNHRTKAAIQAGLKEIPVMYTDEELTKDEQISIQLSHNSIAGEDDPFILQELYTEIEDLEMKYYSGLDDKTLEQLDGVNVTGLTEAQLDYLMLSFLFLPQEHDKMIQALDKAKESLTSETIIARMKDYDRVLDAQEKTQMAYDVHNGATSLMLILDIFERHMDDLQEGYIDQEGEPTHSKFVPIESVFGTPNIPAESASVIIKAVDKMVQEGNVTGNNKWEVMEYLAADYMAGE